MLTIKQQIEKTLELKCGSTMQFLQHSIGKFERSRQGLRVSYNTFKVVLDDIQTQDEPLKSVAQSLANTLRDYIFAALSFCTECHEYIPNPPAEFQCIFVQERINEFFTHLDHLVQDIESTFSEATDICLLMAAKYQGVRPQSLKSNKTLLDMITFPHFCEIEEDVADLNEKLNNAKMLLDDLYAMYFNILQTSPIFFTDNPDPVVELQTIANAMKEHLDECERLFVKKTTLFKMLYDRLSEPEKAEFARQLNTEEKEEEDHEEEDSDSYM